MPMDKSQQEKKKVLEVLVAIDVMLQVRFL